MRKVDQEGQLGLRKSTVVQQVHDYLRDRIVQLDIKPGEKIDVTRLSKELEVSQTPIREALQKLVEQGLVVVKPYVGYFVVQLTPKDVEELFDLRKVLEVLALRYAFKNIKESHVKDLLDRLQIMEHLTGEALVEETRKFDQDFHLGLILQGANSKWLVKYANGILDLIKLTTRLSMNPKAACGEHRQILEAIVQSSLPKAVALLEAHLERAQQEAIAGLEGG